jgi:manganese/zinc/iron transport system substrate-binding protein
MSTRRPRCSVRPPARLCRCALLVALVFSAGCGEDESSATAPSGAAAPPLQYPYTIVTTTGMVADIVRQVASDKATVIGLLGEGVDPHLYKPTRADVVKIITADLIFYSGLMLEGRMSDTFTKAGNHGSKVYPVTQIIDEKYLLEPPDFKGHWDPHVWMDVSAWSQCVQVVADALGDFDPSNATTYQANATVYVAKLDGLHAYVTKVIASIPEQQRVLITAHDAFNYFSRAYGIKVMGVQGISTESEAGLDDINRIVDFIVSDQISAVFVESSVSDKNVKALIEGADAQGHAVTIGGELFSDAMGAPRTYEGTYMGMLDHNATTIARALGGKAPPRGMNGKLSGKSH